MVDRSRHLLDNAFSETTKQEMHGGQYVIKRIERQHKKKKKKVDGQIPLVR